MSGDLRLHLTVGPADDGRRVDVVVGAMPDVGSRAEAQRLIEGGMVFVDGAAVAKRTRVVSGQVVLVQTRGRTTTDLVPEEVPMTIMFEDDVLVVVDKPAGVVTHPARGHASGTLVHGLLAKGITGGDAERPGIVHRLDRDTSGLLVVAKSDRVHRQLQKMLSERTIERRYHALVHGEFPPALTIDRPIGRDRRNRLKVSARTDTPREATTHLRRLELFGRHSLVEARLETGRTHQIRVHLELAGYPVVGDPLYGRRGDELGLDRQFLHAVSLAFVHPQTGEDVHVLSQLPPDLQAVLDRLTHERATSR